MVPGDKMARKGRVLLPALRGPGEHPDTSSKDVGKAGSTPILDPEPKDDRMQSFGKETRPKNFFFFLIILVCFVLFPSPLLLLVSFRGCSKSTLSTRAGSAPLHPAASAHLRRLKPGLRLGEKPQPGLRGSGWDLGPGKEPSLRRAPAGGGKPCAGQLPGSPA